MKVPYHITNFLLIFLFILKEISVIHAIHLEKDITKHLDNWFGSLFKNLDRVKALSAKMRWFNISRDTSEYKYNMINPLKVVPFENLWNSRDPTISHEGVQIQWNFTKNKIHMLSEENIFAIHLPTVKHLVFLDVIKFQNLTCTVNWSEPSDYSDGNKFWYEFSYDKSLSPTYINTTKLTWIDSPNIEELRNQIQSRIFPMARCSIENDLKLICDSYLKPKNRLIASLPNFARDPQQYHYLIPKHRLFCFTMECIVIKGLSNIDSLKFISPSSGEGKYTLVFKNIEGELTLNYERENVTSLKMNFKMDGFSITQSISTSVNHNMTGPGQEDASTQMKSICGKSHGFCISCVETNTTLSTRQMEVMQNGIESAIAYSIFPYNETLHADANNFEPKLKDINITDTSDWEAVKMAYKELIPFND